MRLKIRQMIKLMSLGFIGLALLSCSKGDSEPEYQKPMSFNGYTARSVTKAGDSFVTGTALPSGKAFGVYVYNTGAEADFDPTRVNPEDQEVVAYDKFMSDVKVTYTSREATEGDPQGYNPANDPGNYIYTPLRYWPNDKTNNRLAFFAYYPHNGADITRTGFADFTFTVQDAPSNQVDFMLSDVVANQMYGAAGSLHTNTDVVDLKFYHMLTQIRFKGATDAPSDVKVKIDKLELVDIKATGVLKPEIQATNSIWPETELSNDKTFEITLKTDYESLTLEPIDIAAANQALLMIPQPLANCKLRIKYTITPPAPALTITQSKLLDLSTETITKWVKNQQIVYTINVGLHFIEFKASAVDWSDGPGESMEVE